MANFAHFFLYWCPNGIGKCSGITGMLKFPYVSMWICECAWARVPSFQFRFGFEDLSNISSSYAALSVSKLLQLGKWRYAFYSLSNKMKIACHWKEFESFFRFVRHWADFSFVCRQQLGDLCLLCAMSFLLKNFKMWLHHLMCVCVCVSWALRRR